jgi:hypothetical protein
VNDEVSHCSTDADHTFRVKGDIVKSVEHCAFYSSGDPRHLHSL